MTSGAAYKPVRNPKPCGHRNVTGEFTEAGRHLSNRCDDCDDCGYTVTWATADDKPRRSLEELHPLLCEYPRCKGWEYHQQRYGPLT